MEFWGVEVMVGQSVKVEPGNESIIHLSQACLVDVKKDNEKDTVYLYVNTENQKLCIGTLSAEKFPQIVFDLVFGKEFEISHTSKTGNVHLCGYKTILSEYDSEDMAKETIKESNTGNIAIKEQKTLKPSRQQNHDSDDSSDSLDSSDDETRDTSIPVKAVVEEDDDCEDDSEDEDEDYSDDDDESDDEEEENNDTQNKNNKRENDSVELPVAPKKAKLVTPERNDAKKISGHVATPYPLKQLVKGAGNSDKSKQQSQKTVEFRCNPCNRTFGSENALQSHSKAKHG